MPYRAVLLLFSIPLLAQDFEIRIPPAARDFPFTVAYTLKSPRRILHSWAVSRSGEEALRIPTVFANGAAATALDLAIIAPGCAGAQSSHDLTLAAARTLQFICTSLPRIIFQGSIPVPAHMRDMVYESKMIEADYIPVWAHEFLGVTNGLRLRIAVGKAPLLPDGTFLIDLPDFTHDRNHAGSIEFWAKHTATGKDYAILKTLTEDHSASLSTAKDLPGRIEFLPCVLRSSEHLRQHTIFAVRGASNLCPS